jgi:AcrR family transcriptional regulator
MAKREQRAEDWGPDGAGSPALVGQNGEAVPELQPRVPGRNKRSEETIRQILAAAEQVILESGVDKLAIQDVCEVAGVSRGTFYRYFSSHEELLDAFSKHKRARFHLALHAATAAHLRPDERFNAVIAYLDDYLRHNRSRRLLAVAPEFALGFFKRIFHDSVERFQDVLDIVFDAWDARLGARMDRELVCKLLIRYVLSEVLVPAKGDRCQLLASLVQMTAAISRAGNGVQRAAPAPVRHDAGATLRPAPEPERAGRAAETIRQILVATEQVILESGVGRVSILAVCEVAGISRGTFYRYFSAQDELLEAFTRHKRAIFHQALVGATEPYAEPDQRFAALVAHLDHFLRHNQSRRLLQVAPEYAFGFFQRAFDDSVERFQDALKIVFDAWDVRLGLTLDRVLICEMLIRYVLSEVLVPGECDRLQLPQRIAELIFGIGKSAPAAPLAQGQAVPGMLPSERLPQLQGRATATVMQILAAAEELILESGVARVSILALCKLAGISRGTFYRYFSSQNELLDAFTDHQRAQFHQALNSVAALHNDPDSRFDAVMEHFDRFLGQDKVRRLLLVAPEYACGFFQRIFDDAIARLKSVLDIVFDAWDVRLGTPVDRDLVCELLLRYMRSELLVPTEAGQERLSLRLGKVIRAVVLAR